MSWPKKWLGWVLCLAGGLTLVWAATGAIFQWTALLYSGNLSLFSFLRVFVALCLGLCLAKLGVVMSRD